MKDSNSKKEDNDNNKEEKLYKKIHEHPLLFIYNFDITKQTYIIKSIYEKYLDEIINDKQKLSEMIPESHCHGRDDRI